MPRYIFQALNDQVMKVLSANNYFYPRGGSERVFFDEMEILRAHGHEIIPFSRHFEKNMPSECSRYFASPIEYENVSLAKKIAKGFSLIYSYECRKRFSELLDYFSPDLIHAHNIYGRLTTSIIDAAKKKKIPVVMTLHDYKLICPSYLMLLNDSVCERCIGGKFYRCVLKKCHKGRRDASLFFTLESYFNSIFDKYDYIGYFICPSRFSLKKHAEAGIPEEKLVHIPNFINVKGFEPNYENNGYILYVGRLSREKGVLTLLKAIKSRDIPVRIVGDGPMRGEYESFVKENDISNVFFEGYKRGDELRNLFINATFLIFPSTWYETFGLVALEAFAHGKPVIGANIGGIPEMVIEDETGLLFEPGNHQDLTEKLCYLFSHSSEVVRMGRNARKKVEDEYNADLHFQRLSEVYKKACS